MGSFWQDLLHAGRNIRNSPGFAIVAMVTLALGGTSGSWSRGDHNEG